MSNNLKDKGPNGANKSYNGKHKNGHNNSNNNNKPQPNKKQSIFEQGLPILAIPGLKVLDFTGKPDPIGLEEASRSFFVYVGREMSTFESEIFDTNGKLHEFEEPVVPPNYEQLSKVQKHRFEKKCEIFDKDVHIFENNMRKTF